MANYPNFHQMPKNSYPRNAHPVYSLVGSLIDIVVGGLDKINKVSFAVISGINKVVSSKFGKIDKAQN